MLILSSCNISAKEKKWREIIEVHFWKTSLRPHLLTWNLLTLFQVHKIG